MWLRLTSSRLQLLLLLLLLLPRCRLPEPCIKRNEIELRQIRAFHTVGTEGGNRLVRRQLLAGKLTPTCESLLVPSEATASLATHQCAHTGITSTFYARKYEQCFLGELECKKAQSNVP